MVFETDRTRSDQLRFFCKEMYPLELLPPQSDFQGKIFLNKNFHPFSGLDGWKLATNGGSWQHFYRRLNASKSARIESREDSKTHSVAKIGENGVFFVKRARCNPRFSHFGCPSTLRGLEHPCITKSSRAFYKKTTIFPDFRHAMSLRILSTLDSRAFRRI